MPRALQPEELRSRLHAEVARLLPGRLDEEAVLPLVHVLTLLDHTEHGLVHLVALLGGGGGRRTLTTVAPDCGADDGDADAADAVAVSSVGDQAAAGLVARCNPVPGIQLEI